MVFEEEPPDWGSVQTLPNNTGWVGGKTKTEQPITGLPSLAAASQLLRLRSRRRLRRVRKKLRWPVNATWTCIRTGASPAPKDELTCATTRTSRMPGGRMR